MKVSSLADKIISEAVKSFYETGEDIFSADSITEKYPKVKPHLIYAAIRALDRDGMVTVSYADDEPNLVAININAITNYDEDTLLKKGYELMKELRQWF